MLCNHFEYGKAKIGNDKFYEVIEDTYLYKKGDIVVRLENGEYPEFECDGIPYVIDLKLLYIMYDNITEIDIHDVFIHVNAHDFINAIELSKLRKIECDDQKVQRLSKA